ncbi:MAG: DUF2726 domain-containing protein, partial [Ruminiclostridium sp.]|nr:DUF2726 domain-containing protein [Ruminiclostridium sp.]
MSMVEWYGYVFIFFIIAMPFAFIFGMISAIKEKKLATPPEEKETDIENGEAETTEEYPYIKPYLLTKKEWAFYKALKPITDKYHLHILAKVRLADLVEVKKGLSNSQYFKAFAKIKAKH